LPRRCPSGRVSSPTRDLNGRQIVDTDTYIPYFLAVVNNALSRSASAQYLKDFGIGIGEWRVLSILANEPGIAASRICQVVAMDKAAVSRSLDRLNKQDLLHINHAENDPRRRSLSLNPAGYDLHDRILQVALERERALIEGVDPADLECFLRVMRTMRDNVANL
jgi:DNA-binding MarR family transcriptional regulator